MDTCSIGEYLGIRLAEAGIEHYFAVPGDYNLLLLDEMLKASSLQLVGCCNELNAGYAADGYARARGVGAAVVTFSVGGLSAINAVAGSYAEDMPVVLISGGPNANDMMADNPVHHGLGKEKDPSYVRDIFANVTCDAAVIRKPEDAPELIDRAIDRALSERKPVYIEIACNLADLPVSRPVPRAPLH